MKTIGLIGGMSWESSMEYYRIINEGIKSRLGGLNSARCILFSVNFGDIEKLQVEGKWDEAAIILADAGRSLEKAGADCVVLCTNTMHKVATQIQSAVNIPLIHITDTTANKIQSQGIIKVGLLGTRFTMEEDFYKYRLTDQYKLDVIIPDFDEREMIHHAIYDELCLGIIKTETHKRFISAIQHLGEKGVEGIILGCTEIGLLVRQDDVHLPIFDTTLIHATAAVDFALK
jgi:aspartate racemase